VNASKSGCRSSNQHFSDVRIGAAEGRARHSNPTGSRVADAIKPYEESLFVSSAIAGFPIEPHYALWPLKI